MCVLRPHGYSFNVYEHQQFDYISGFAFLQLVMFPTQKCFILSLQNDLVVRPWEISYAVWFTIKVTDSVFCKCVPSCFEEGHQTLLAEALVGKCDPHVVNNEPPRYTCTSNTPSDVFILKSCRISIAKANSKLEVISQTACICFPLPCGISSAVLEWCAPLSSFKWCWETMPLVWAAPFFLCFFIYLFYFPVTFSLIWLLNLFNEQQAPSSRGGGLLQAQLSCPQSVLIFFAELFGMPWENTHCVFTNHKPQVTEDIPPQWPDM